MASTSWAGCSTNAGDTAICVHIPEAGPMTQAVAASLDEARAFFPRHFPDEHYAAFSCGSWLLDPQLLEYLPEDSNIVSFQHRFELEPYEAPEGLDADVEVLRFVFRTLTTALDQLPRRTVLQGAIVDPPQGRPPLAVACRPLPRLALAVLDASGTRPRGSREYRISVAVR